MDRRAATAPLDPALAVSDLLTRLGLFGLVVVAPVLSMLSRRAAGIAVPVATALLILAAVLDGRLPAALGRFGEAVASVPALALVLLLGWAAVTLAWTPLPGLALAHLLNLIVTIALFAGTVAALRETTRLSDVNLIPIGVLIAAFALGAAVLPGSPLAAPSGLDPNSQERIRAAALLALLVWPGLAALVSRGRLKQAAALGVVVAAALWLAHNLVVIAAFLVGAGIFVLAHTRLRLARGLVGGLVLAMLVLAPLAGWVMANYGGFLLPGEGDALVAVWRDVTYSLPSRLVQGFGFDASTALTRGVGGVPLQSPRNAALQVWLELGVVGVLAVALALLAALLSVARADPKARAATLAVWAGSAVMMFAGLAAWQSWWIGTLGLTAVSLAFVSRRAERRRQGL